MLNAGLVTSFCDIRVIKNGAIGKFEPEAIISVVRVGAYQLHRIGIIRLHVIAIG